MAVSLSKLFIRSISQPFDHTQTGISLWTLEDIEAKQKREKEEEQRILDSMGDINEIKKKGGDEEYPMGYEGESDEYEMGGMDESDLLGVPMDMD